MAQDRREETAELERALRAAVEGFEVRDEEILLEGSPSALRPGGEARRAELAGTMEGGRAVLVLRPSRRDGPAELAAIDALAWTEECGEVLALRVGADPGRDVLVVLVVAPPDSALRSALRTLRSDRLVVLVERRLQSARGEDLRLAPLDLTGRSTARADQDPAAFLARLAPPARAWAEAAARGVGRIDPDLRAGVADSALVWRDASGVRCALRARGAEVVGEAGGVGLPLAGAEEVERFLEAALRTCADAERAAPGAPSAPAGNAARAEPRSQDAPRALLPQGPLLSEDELAALRGDG